MNNLTALDKPEQLLQLVFGLLWTTKGVDYLLLFLSHKLCGRREHRSFWSVEGIESIMNSQSFYTINCFVICQGGTFLSCQERTLEFAWGMQQRQRYQFQRDVWGSISKVLVTCKAPLCVSRNLQWKQPLKGSLLVFFVWAHWDNGVRTLCRRLALLFPVQSVNARLSPALLPAQPSGQSHLSYLLLFFVICARFAAAEPEAYLRN